MVRPLLPYPPDFDPTENFFAKLKALLRKAAKRDIKTLWKHWPTAQQLLSKRVLQLLRWFRICQHFNRKCSRRVFVKVFYAVF